MTKRHTGGAPTQPVFPLLLSLPPSLSLLLLLLPFSPFHPALAVSPRRSPRPATGALINFRQCQIAGNAALPTPTTAMQPAFFNSFVCIFAVSARRLQPLCPLPPPLPSPLLSMPVPTRRRAAHAYGHMRADGQRTQDHRRGLERMREGGRGRRSRRGEDRHRDRFE